MKRYYVCRVVGDGSDVAPYRPKVADYGVGFVTVLASNANGSPKFNWCLVLVDAVDHAQLLADNQIKAIPDAGLDVTWGSLSTPVRNAVTKALTDDGIATAWIKNTTTIREIVRYLGQQHEATFNENKFDVA